MGVLISFPATGNNLNERFYELRTKCRETFQRFNAAETFTQKQDEMSRFQRLLGEYVIVAERKVDEARTCVLALMRQNAQAMIRAIDAAERIARETRGTNIMLAKSQRKNCDATVLAFSRAKS